MGSNSIAPGGTGTLAAEAAVGVAADDVEDVEADWGVAGGVTGCASFLSDTYQAAV